MQNQLHQSIREQQQNLRVSSTTSHVRYAAVVVLVLVVLGGGIAVVWQTDDDQVKLLNPKSHSTTIPIYKITGKTPSKRHFKRTATIIVVTPRIKMDFVC